jgi:hypothetical protein
VHGKHLPNLDIVSLDRSWCAEFIQLASRDRRLFETLHVRSIAALARRAARSRSRALAGLISARADGNQTHLDDDLLFSTLRNRSLSPYQLSAETGHSIAAATQQLHAHAAVAMVPDAKVILTATTLSQRAAEVEAIETRRQHAKGMQLMRPPAKVPPSAFVELETIVSSDPELEASPSALAASKSGLKESTVYEPVFVFPPSAERRYLGSSFRRKATHVLQNSIAPAAFFLIQLCFGLSLLISILAILTAILVLIIDIEREHAAAPLEFGLNSRYRSRTRTRADCFVHQIVRSLSAVLSHSLSLRRPLGLLSRTTSSSRRRSCRGRRRERDGVRMELLS